MLSYVDIVTVLTCLITLTAAIALMTRVPWRTGFLCLMVGLMPLTHILVLLRERLGWEASMPKPLTDVAELLVSSLFLIAVLMLRIDAQDRLSKDARLRLAEALVPHPLLPSPDQHVRQLDGLQAFRSMLSAFTARRSAKHLGQGGAQSFGADRLR